TSSCRKVKGRLGIISPCLRDNLWMMPCHYFAVRCFVSPFSSICLRINMGGKSMRFIAEAVGSSAARRWLACGTSALALAVTAAPALAQDEAGAAAEDDDRTILVTGSRVRADGMQAPVPLTVVNA